MSVFRGSNPLHDLGPGVRGLLIANVAVFLLQIVLPYTALEEIFALHSLQSGRPFWPWQVVTYSFLHGSGLHLFFNMWVLWMMGNALESAMGTRSFVLYYFLCVVGAAATHLLLVPAASAVGASGGIYGLLVAFAIFYPDSVLYLFFVFPMKTVHAVWLLGLFALAFAMGSGGDRIAHFAHLGGMATGFLYFKLPQWFRRLRTIGRGRPKFHVIRPTPSKEQEEAEHLQKEVDRILEKISLKGLDSLSEKEHETMRAYAKRKR